MLRYLRGGTFRPTIFGPICRCALVLVSIGLVFLFFVFQGADVPLSHAKGSKGDRERERVRVPREGNQQDAQRGGKRVHPY